MNNINRHTALKRITDIQKINKFLISIKTIVDLKTNVLKRLTKCTVWYKKGTQAGRKAQCESDRQRRGKDRRKDTCAIHYKVDRVSQNITIQHQHQIQHSRHLLFWKSMQYVMF